MIYATNTTTFVIAVMAAALMLSLVVAIMPQANAVAQRVSVCNPHSPNGGVSSPPCRPLRAR